MVWLPVAGSNMTDFGKKEDESKLWKDAEQKGGSTLPMPLLMNRRAELFYSGYTFSDGLTDLMFCWNRFRKRLV